MTLTDEGEAPRSIDFAIFETLAGRRCLRFERMLAERDSCLQHEFDFHVVSRFLAFHFQAHKMMILTTGDTVGSAALHGSRRWLHARRAALQGAPCNLRCLAGAKLVTFSCSARPCRRRAPSSSASSRTASRTTPSSSCACSSRTGYTVDCFPRGTQSSTDERSCGRVACAQHRVSSRVGRSAPLVPGGRHDARGDRTRSAKQSKSVRAKRRKFSGGGLVGRAFLGVVSARECLLQKRHDVH